MSDLTPILPAHIEDTVRAIAELHADHHRRASAVQRIVERSVALVGRPRFVGLLTGLVVAWIVGNLFLGLLHRAFDPPPFSILQDIGELLGLYITVLILISQRRQDELAQTREQLTLELAILGEQKSAKTIELLEELRRDHPMIRDRHDPEALAMSVPANPQAVLEAIQDTHEEMLAELNDAPAQETSSAVDPQSR